MRAMLELGYLPLAVDGFLRDTWQQSLERWGQASNYRIVCGSRFQGDEDGVEAKARVGSNPHLADVRRNVGEAGVQHFYAAIPGSGVSWPEFSIPEVG
jgi:hypothetical protein